MLTYNEAIKVIMEDLEYSRERAIEKLKQAVIDGEIRCSLPEPVESVH